jgi:hypothetical protein
MDRFLTMARRIVLSIAALLMVATFPAIAGDATKTRVISYRGGVDAPGVAGDFHQ